MASFAPSYQQESNDVWLNDVLGDIVGGSGPSTSAFCRTAGRDYDDDMVDAPSDEDRHLQKDLEKKRSDTSLRQLRSPLSFTSRSAAPSRRPSIPQRHASIRRGSGNTHFIVTSPRSPLSPRSEALGHLRIPSSPAPSYSDLGSPVLGKPRPVYNRYRSTRTELELICDCPQLEKQVSSDSVFSGFAQHPAVRPLQTREVFGEAAGRTNEDAEEYPAPLALSLILLGVCLAVFIISLDRNIITTAIPRITAQFHSYSDIGWYGSGYLLTASAFQPLYGRIYMTFNTKKTFLGALGVFEVGSILCAVAPSSTVLIVGRAIQGLGSAGILTGAFVIGTHAVPLQQRPVLFAAVGILYGAGALCGPLLGGVFTDLATWRWCFYVNLPVGATTLITVMVFFHPKQRSPTTTPRPTFLARILRLDLVGNAILLAASVMLFLALELSEQRDSWSSAPVIGLLCGFSVTTILFIAWVWRKGDDALIPPRIISQRTVLASCLAAFCIYAALVMHSYYLPIWFQAIKGANAIQSGRNMLPYMLANALFGLIAGIFVSKNGLFAPPAIVGCAIGTIGAGLFCTLTPSSSSGHWIGFEVLTSAGLGLAVQQGFSAVQTALPLALVPIGTAAVVASQSLGGAVFVSIGNTLLQDYLLDANNDKLVPGVDVRLVIREGATAFRAFVPPEALPALLELYNTGLRKVFIAATVMSGLAFVMSLGMEWKSVRAGQEPGDQDEGNGKENSEDGDDKKYEI